MTTTAFLLIALLKTSGEGGTVQIPYPDLDSCMAGGRALQEQFEALPHRPLLDGTLPEGGPKVIFTCLEAPVQTNP
jgi:hypothetical protein